VITRRVRIVDAPTRRPGVSTAYDYRDEAITVLAARKSSLRGGEGLELDGDGAQHGDERGGDGGGGVTGRAGRAGRASWAVAQAGVQGLGGRVRPQ
jgi:hypothetical protein